MESTHRIQPLGPSSFGLLLKRYRVGAGLTQEALAERAGLSARGISDLERGVVSRPQHETLIHLIRALDLSARDRLLFESAAGPTSSRHPSSTTRSITGSARLPTLVGRLTELDFIERHLLGDTPPVLLFSGEPGIGKSRLLAESLRLASGMGLTILHGGGRRTGGQEPYAPVLEALTSSFDRLSRPKLRAALAGCSWLTRLLPELIELVPAPFPIGTLSVDQERRLIVAAVARYLSNIAGPAGTLLVIDDLQWSGTDGIDLLSALISSAPDNPVRMMGAYRDTEVDATHLLTGFLAHLAERNLVHHIALRPLPLEESLALLTELLAAEDYDNLASVARERMLEASGGLPFFLVSFAQGLFERQSVETDWPEVPWSAIQSIRRRVAELSPTAQSVLRLAAVVGRSISRSVLLAAIDRPEHDVMRALDEICRARLLSEETDRTYCFVHDVVREAIEGDLGAAQRIILHREIAEALEEQSVRFPAQLAWHFREGDLPERALAYAIEAGDAARAVFAHDAAETEYRIALKLCGEVQNNLRRAETLEKLGSLLRRLGRYEEGLSLLEEAAVLYEEASDLDSVGRVLGDMGWTYSHRGTPEAGIARLQAMIPKLEEAGPSAGLVHTYGALVHLLMRPSGPNRVKRAHYAERAGQIARTLGDERLLVQGRLNEGLALLWNDQLLDALGIMGEVVAQAERIQDKESQFRGLSWSANLYIATGDFASGEQCAQKAAMVAEQLGNMSFRTTALDQSALVQFLMGNWRRARCVAELAISTDPAISTWAAGEAHLTLAEIALAEGRWEETSAHLEASRVLATTGETLPVNPHAQRIMAERDLFEHKPERAIARLLPLEASLDYTCIERMVLSNALLENEDVKHAGALIELGVEQSRHTGRIPVLVDWLRLQGMYQCRRQQWASAHTAFVEGVAAANSLIYPYGSARLHYEWARAFEARSDYASARDHFDQALELFEQLGAVPWLLRTKLALTALP